MRFIAFVGAMLSLLAGDSLALAAGTQKKPPFFASISAGRARMRTGPARTYPATWLYQRRDLPVRVVAIYKEWRKVEDPDGTSGWMLANLISERRSGIVRGQVPVNLHATPSDGAKVVWRAAPGVVGLITDCNGSWCKLDVNGQGGFVAIAAIWGVAPGEELP